MKQAGAESICEPFFAHGYRRKRSLHNTRATVLAVVDMLLTRALLADSWPTMRAWLLRLRCAAGR